MGFRVKFFNPEEATMSFKFDLNAALLEADERRILDHLSAIEGSRELSDPSYDKLLDELIDVQNRLASIRPSQVVASVF